MILCALPHRCASLDELEAIHCPSATRFAFGMVKVASRVRSGIANKHRIWHTIADREGMSSEERMGTVANHRQLERLLASSKEQNGCRAWNQWRNAYPFEQIDLTGADLHGVDLFSAYLRDADLLRADLRGADLSGANLRGANLSRVDLRSADLTGADLTNAVLTHAVLWATNFLGAHLSAAQMSGAQVRGTNLSGVDFTEANLTGVDFT